MAQYLDLAGGAGDYTQTPHAADMDITGDIAVAVKVAMDDWTPATQSSLMAKSQVGSAVGRAWAFYIGTDGKPRFHFWHSSGTGQFGLSSAATGFTDGTTNWVGAERNQSAGTVKYYTSSDGSSWTQLGTTQTSISTNNIDTSTHSLRVGRSWELSAAGEFYEAKLYSGSLTGTLIAHFNGNDFTVGDSDTATANDVEGNTWTIFGATSEIFSDSTGFVGSGTPSQAAQTSTGTGNFDPPSFVGTGTPTQAAQTSTGTGNFDAPSFVGSGTPTQDNQTATGAGTFTPAPVTGSGAPTQDNQTATGTGNVDAPSFTGSGAPSQANQTSTGTGLFTAVGFTGSGSPSEGNDTATGTGVNGSTPAPAVQVIATGGITSMNAEGAVIDLGAAGTVVDVYAVGSVV